LNGRLRRPTSSQIGVLAKRLGNRSQILVHSWCTISCK
jgi:hypothetical protein